MVAAAFIAPLAPLGGRRLAAPRPGRAPRMTTVPPSGDAKPAAEPPRPNKKKGNGKPAATPAATPAAAAAEPAAEATAAKPPGAAPVVTAAASAAAAVAPDGAAAEDMSMALPWAPRPVALDTTLPAYAGFDPWGLSERFDPRYLVEGEVKNGRAAMLGIVGMVVQEFWHLPGGPAFANPTPAGAWHDAPTALLWLIFFACGAAEVASYKGEFTYTKMMAFFDKNPARQGGTFGLDILGLLDRGEGAEREELAHRLRTSEIKHGRLAMIAAGGMILQSTLFHTPVVAQIIALTHGGGAA